MLLSPWNHRHDSQTCKYKLYRVVLDWCTLRCPDAQIPRSPDAKIPRCPEAQIPRCPDTQMPRSPDVQTYINPGPPGNYKLNPDQTLRLKTLKQNCQKYYNPYKSKICKNPSSKSSTHPISTNCNHKTPTWWSYDWLADRNKNLAICMPPKAGCTTWQRFYQAVEHLDERFLNETGDSIFGKTPRLSKFTHAQRAE